MDPTIRTAQATWEAPTATSSRFMRFMKGYTAAFALTLTREQETELREDMSYEAGSPGFEGMNCIRAYLL